LKIEIDLLLI